MAKRGRKPKNKVKVSPETTKSVFAIFLLMAAVIVLISFFAPDYALNKKIQKVILGLFGWAAIFIPFIMAIGGLLYLHLFKSKIVQLKTFLGLLFFMFFASSLASSIGIKSGKVGNSVDEFLSDSISSGGSFVMLFALTVATVFFIFNVSFAQISEFFAFILEKLSFKKEKKSRGFSVDDDIKISTGSPNPDSDEFVEDGAKDNLEDNQDISENPETPATFEVIPSLSEPKSAKLEITPEAILATAKSTKPGLPYSDRVWENPPLDLLSDPSTVPIDRGDVMERAKIIVATLRSFGIDSKVSEINFGPSVTQYALEAGSGVRIAKVANLQNDIALALASPTGSVRIEAPIPGKSLIGIEVPNNTRVPVCFKEIFNSDAMRGMKSKRGIVLGKDVSGAHVVYDIAKMPHLLVAGSTGSGKSVFLHSLIFSILYRCSPQECKFLFIDPKRVELVHYSGIPHLLAPVVTETDKAPALFRWLVSEMEKRYKLLEQAKVRNIDGYNEKTGFQVMPYIVVVVDELAEIMISDPQAVEKSIVRLAQLARAVGIHLVLTIQRPSADVLTGLIKANIPCRIAFGVTSQVDSRVIIDQPGAEKLLGKGDMLFVPPDAAKPVRIQGAFVSEKEIANVVAYLKQSGFEPELNHEIFENKDQGRSLAAGGEGKDPLFDEAIETILSAQKASASLLQRRLQIGYARAARILDELEASGVIGSAQGSKPRDILVSQKGQSTHQEFDNLAPQEEHVIY
ncbi:DNA translocase FtsK [candidate division WWE3 bacterium]|nr:DNA translocase FtsK [candidate division WWE3 bacterium]